MSEAVRPWMRAPHLAAAALAAAAMAGLLGIAFGPLHLERRLAHFIGPAILDVKDQGLALQDEAFRDKDLLPIYGSSEFRNATAYSGRMFFSHFPTGFELFIVGKAGAKPLITAERLGALGEEIRGKKVVVILSPTWFLTRQETVPAYEANFSALQAERLAFGSALSPALKADLAREMLKYPHTLEGRPLLNLELRRLASGRHSPADRLVLGLGRSEYQFLALLDHVQSAFALSGEWVPNLSSLSDAGRHPKTPVNWNELLQKAAATASPEEWESGNDTAAPKLARKLKGKTESPFAGPNQTDEWDHLVLLLRTLRELGAKPLFLSIPLNASAFETAGTPASQLQPYYDRLRRTVGEFGFPLATFEREQRDPSFFGDSLGHPSAKGWMMFNHVIDQFYHGKLPPALD